MPAIGAQNDNKMKQPRARKNSNQYDSLKVISPALVAEVSLGKVEKGISIILQDGAILEGGQTFSPSRFTDGWMNPASGFTKMFKHSKGERVKILRDGKKDLYGLLEFNKVYIECNDVPSTRAYYIKIPEQFLEQAEGGNLAVVYEYYECKPTEDSGSNKYTTWALWISDIPF